MAFTESKLYTISNTTINNSVTEKKHSLNALL